MAGLDDVVDLCEKAGLVVLSEGGDGVIEKRDVRNAQQRARKVIGQAIGPRARQKLVQQRQGIARGTAAGLNDHGIDGVFDLHALGSHGPLQQPLHRGRGKQAEGIVVRPGANGADDLFRLRRRKDENHVLRRLFNHLEQRIGTRRGNHVRLVDDEDAIARFRRRIVGAVAQLAHVLHAIVRGGIELRHVQVARAAGRERHARIALAARRRGGPVLAVERAGHNPRRRRLTAAARAGKEVGVVDAPRVEGGR